MNGYKEFHTDIKTKKIQIIFPSKVNYRTLLKKCIYNTYKTV